MRIKTGNLKVSRTPGSFLELSLQRFYTEFSETWRQAKGKRTLQRITAVDDVSLINKAARRGEDKLQPYVPQTENLRVITNFTNH